MKIISMTALFAALVATSSAQGLVVFANTPTTLVSAGSMGQNAPISGPPGSFFFGLLVANPGAADPSQFTFTGVYATNGPLAGRVLPATYAPEVPGWQVGDTMSFLVAGWSASLGHDWNQAWMSGSFASSGYFGLSMIGVGAAGGPAGGVPAPALPLFSFGTSIMNGWNLEAVPEPTTAMVLAVGAALVMLRRLRETGSHKSNGEL